MGVVIILAIGALIAVVALVVSQNARERFDKTFDGAAHRLRGQYLRAGLFALPKIIYRASGRPAELSIWTGENARTAVEIDMRGHSPGSLKIFPEGFGAGIAKFFGGQDIEIGDPQFDGLYVVKSQPESLARRLFAVERRARVVRTVRRLGAFTDMCIDLSRERLLVQVQEHVTEEDLLVAIGQVAVELVEHLKELEPGREADVWIVEAPLTAGQCQVCGTEMKDDRVHCARCRTPHHEECWRYVGECSTYACREKRYVSGGRVVPPAPGPLPEVDEAIERFERRQRMRREAQE